MSKGFDMLRDYIEHDALCMRRRKCCDFEYELQQEFAALEAENAKLRELAKGLSWCSEEHYLGHPESECPLYDESVDGKCRAEVLMKELGIEVPS